MSSGTDNAGKFYGPDNWDEFRKDMEKEKREDLIVSLQQALHYTKQAIKANVPSPFQDELPKLETKIQFLITNYLVIEEVMES